MNRNRNRRRLLAPVTSQEAVWVQASFAEAIGVCCEKNGDSKFNFQYVAVACPLRQVFRPDLPADARVLSSPVPDRACFHGV